MPDPSAARVLIVQDDMSTSQQLELSLRARGYRTYATDLGEEAIELAATFIYDAILLDDSLPDFSGLSVLREIRSRGVTTPVIFMSTSAHDLMTAALDSGADYVVHLLCPIDQLTAVIRALSRRRAPEPFPAPPTLSSGGEADRRGEGAP